MIREVISGIFGLGIFLVGLVGIIPRVQALVQAHANSRNGVEIVFFLVVALLGASIFIVTIRHARARAKKRRIMEFRVRD